MHSCDPQETEKVTQVGVKRKVTSWVNQVQKVRSRKEDEKDKVETMIHMEWEDAPLHMDTITLERRQLVAESKLDGRG